MLKDRLCLADYHDFVIEKINKLGEEWFDNLRCITQLIRCMIGVEALEALSEDDACFDAS